MEHIKNLMMEDMFEMMNDVINRIQKKLKVCQDRSRHRLPLSTPPGIINDKFLHIIYLKGQFKVRLKS